VANTNDCNTIEEFSGADRLLQEVYSRLWDYL
jgi:hypothetical protein